MNKIILAAVAAMSTLGFSGVAHANCSPGFLADVACQMGIIDQDTANTFDRANAAAGQPVDNAVYRGMDYLVPGSGGAAQTYAQMRQRGMFNGAPQPVPQAPAPQFVPGPMGPSPFQPGMMAPRFATVCVSQAGPVPMMGPVAIGAPCMAVTPYGTLPGIAQ